MKKLLSLITVLVLACSVSACFGAGNDNSVANAGEAFKVLSLDDLKANSSKDKPIVVEFWHSFGHNISSSLDPLIEEFEELYANQGIYIDVKATSTGGGYDGLRSRVNLGTKSNSIPTMLLGYPDHFADYINSGILLGLDGFINSTDSNVGLDDVSDYYENYWRENEMKIDGKDAVVGIPFNKSTEVMYYNASAVDPILTELGYMADNGKWMNPTWDQVWAVSRILKERANSANGLSWDYRDGTAKSTKCTYPTFIDSDANFFITSTRQWGGQYTTADGLVAFNNSEAVEAQTYFKQLADGEKIWNIPNKLNQSYGSYLMNNLEAFISIGSTAGVNNNDSPKYELKITSYPQRSYEEGTPKAVIQQGTNAAILSKNSNNLTRLSAWLLIKYLTSTDVTTRFSMETGYLPVRKSARESQEYQDFLAAEEDLFTGNVAKTVNAAYMQQEYMYTDPAFSGSSIVRDKVGTMIVAMYCNDKGVQAAIDSAYAELERLGLKIKK